MKRCNWYILSLFGNKTRVSTIPLPYIVQEGVFETLLEEWRLFTRISTYTFMPGLMWCRIQYQSFPFIGTHLNTLWVINVTHDKKNQRIQFTSGFKNKKTRLRNRRLFHRSKEKHVAVWGVTHQWSVETGECWYHVLMFCASFQVSQTVQSAAIPMQFTVHN